MAQTKLGSFVEAWANIGVGFSINWCANMLVLPLFDFAVTGGQAFVAPDPAKITDVFFGALSRIAGG